MFAQTSIVRNSYANEEKVIIRGLNESEYIASSFASRVLVAVILSKTIDNFGSILVVL